MSPKIEKTWGTAFGQTAIKRKDSLVEDSLNTKQDGGSRQDSSSSQQDPNQNQSDSNQETVIDRATLEKAIAELRAADHFTHTDMNVEIVASGPALFVRFVRASGEVVKMMSAADFMKLNKGNTRDDAPRGKILDQKF